MNGIDLVALTLLHFVWQGAVIHATLTVLLAVTRPRSANARDIMGVCALAHGGGACGNDPSPDESRRLRHHEAHSHAP